MNNKGSSVVEVSLIMPIVLGMLVLVIFLFLDTINDGRVQQDGYSIIYTYQQRDGLQGYLDDTGSPVAADAGEMQVSNGNYCYQKEGHLFITEVDVCSDRLRRWQVYGDIVCE